MTTSGPPDPPEERPPLPPREGDLPQQPVRQEGSMGMIAKIILALLLGIPVVVFLFGALLVGMCTLGK